MYYAKKFFLLLLLLSTHFFLAQQNQLDQDIQIYINDLNSQSARIKFSAVTKLGKIGPKAVSAIPKLIETLNDENSRIVLWAMRSLEKIGRANISAFKNPLDKGEDNLKWKILKILRGIGPQTESIIDDFAILLNNKNLRVRIQALKLLEIIPSRAVSVQEELSQILTKDQDKIRILAIKVFCALGEKVVDPAILVEALQDKNQDICDEASKTLVNVGSKALPLLKKAYQNDKMQEQIIDILGKAQPTTESIQFVISAFTSNRLRVRLKAKKALETIKKPAVPLIVEQLTTENMELTDRFIVVLESIGTQAAQATQKLIEVLKHRTDKHKMQRVFIRIGKVSVPQLGALLSSDNQQQQNFTKNILMHMDCTDWAVSVLENKKIHDDLMEILEQRADVVSLAKNLQNPNKTVQEDLCKILISLQKKALSASSILIDHLQHENSQTYAKNILLNIGKPVIPKLINALRSDSDATCKNAKEVLSRMGRICIDPLLESLLEKDIQKDVMSLLQNLKGSDLITLIYAFNSKYERRIYQDKRRKKEQQSSEIYYSTGIELFKNIGFPIVTTLIDELVSESDKNKTTYYYDMTDSRLLQILESINETNPLLIPIFDKFIRDNYLFDKFIRNRKFQSYILKTLQKMGKQATPALPTIEYIIDSQQLNTQIAAIETLGYIGETAIPMLKMIYKERDSRLQMHAITALDKISPTKDIVKNQKVLASHVGIFKQIESKISYSWPKPKKYYIPKYRHFYSYDQLTISFSKDNFPTFHFLLTSAGIFQVTIAYSTKQKYFMLKIHTGDYHQQIEKPTFKDLLPFLSKEKFKCVHKVSELTLNHTEIDSRYLSYFRKLRTLTISPPCQVTDEVIDNLPSYYLTSLTLNVDISDKHLKELSKLKLRTLSLNSNILTNEGLNFLSAFTKLTELHLQKVPNIKDFSALKDLPNLTKLSLINIRSNNLAFLSSLEKLQSLSVSKSPIAPQDAILLQNMKNLSHLDVSHTPITDKEMEILKQLPSLKVLNISRTAVTDKGVVDITNSLQLKELHISSEISSNVVKEIQKKCKVIISK